MGLDSNDIMLLEKDTYWYALYTMPRTEKKVYERIVSMGIEAYLPLVHTLKIWSDRKKKIAIPLIPSILFVRADVAALNSVLDVSGALGFIKYMKIPAKIRNYEIDNIRILLKEPGFYTIMDEMVVEEGEEIEVVRGAFAGLLGRCIRMQGKYKIVIEIKALGSMIEVNVPISFVQAKSLKVA